MIETEQKIRALVVGAIAILALVLPAGAGAANETLSSSFSLEPLRGQFLNNGFRPANWQSEGTVSVPPGEPEILPSKVIDIGNPPGEVTFNPGKMPVCGDEIGPDNVSVPVDVVVARCPNSVLGNGTALFAFNRIPTVQLDGVIVAFNGGLRNGLPLVKNYAYSYDTEVGIYTEAVLDKAGRLKYEIPQLTADSAVTTLNLAIPGKRQVLEGIDPGGGDVILPKGQKTDYVKARCSTGQWPYDSKFTLGTRDTDNNPTSPDSFVTDSGILSCTGVTGKAKVRKIKVQGPNRVKRGRQATYRITVRNTGEITARGVRVKVSGKGIKFNNSVGKIGAKKSRTVKVKVKPRKKGKVKMKVKVTSKNGGGKTVKKTIRVG